MPAEKPVNPDMAPWTACWERTVQYTLSPALAGMERIMYVGSMFTSLCSLLRCFKNSLMDDLRYTPMSPLIDWVAPPFASSCAECCSWSSFNTTSAIPSAATTTACPCLSNTLSKCSRNAFSLKGISGMSAMSTSFDAREAIRVMAPLWRPMRRTMPTPFMDAFASTFADMMALCASSMEVSNPNDLSMRLISLSIVFGIPTTLIFIPRSLAVA
mmetsp:Transcript_320/g.593  ORF Transcript_320/g.593 Transcript_320/m.593 type:complete len:214 (-) Transcript_320:110-751(-)